MGAGCSGDGWRCMVGVREKAEVWEVGRVNLRQSEIRLATTVFNCCGKSNRASDVATIFDK